MDPGVEKRVRQAAAALEADGVAVRSTSIPEHPSFGSLRVPLLLLGSYELMRTTDSRRHTNLPVPCGTVDSLSAGCMLVGRHCDEATLYRLAAAVEAT
jgi:Asp-tRNA(Asn)/Glu-tRNA(Gln) amidotransferase A subunit family amidase